ncbi:longitudinals lacking protein, isoforms A/B/D/L-like isoform X2 [Daphnia pulicaria]|uniref:longitudinals lacking protein, isoforms A/B/D/L-like isoform X2 n=1 Tax=Daphnia pulicaria TaxID=35523 RepID=UPI001EEA9AAF|nr:longitudinals lacking protein, isoforms A/B/D/L-like isoform X2 [Daphnia pulicaria]
MGTDLREFCLRWNNHHNTLISVLDTLLMKERLVDVTLAAEGQFINVHRIVLFACSQYFEELLSQLPDKQAVVFLKDVQFVDLKALVDYMYRGEVNVSQDRLNIFLETAYALKIKGLVDHPQHKKFTASLPETFLPSRTKARMNGSKPYHISLGKYPSSVNTDESAHSPAEARSLSSPPMQMIEASLTGEEEPEQGEEERDLTQDEEEDEEETEPGVFVAEMEPDDPFVSAKPDENMDSEFGDDHFEATENWSYNDPEDEYWNNSQEQFSTSANNNSNGGSETWTPTPNDAAGPSRTRRNNKKNPLSSTVTSPKSRGRGGRTPQAVRKTKYDPTKPFSCPQCQRRYNRKDNLQAHMRYECGQDPQFSCPVCQHKFTHRRYIQKHMQRRHPAEYEEFQKLNPSESV